MSNSVMEKAREGIRRQGLRALVPFEIRDSIRWGAGAPARLLYRGSRQYCPVCRQSFRTFRSFGVPDSRPNACCPECGSLERHRLTWLFLQRMTGLFDGEYKRMLHIAPERIFQRRLREALGNGYISGDLQNPRAMVKLDVTDIPFGDATFDVVYCSHVLEHVPDDQKAMQEFRRVLKPGGWALLLVPISAGETMEAPRITDPREREQVFGQSDHVRRYGADYLGRLVAAGFLVQRFEPEAFVTEAETKRMRLVNERCDMFFCMKQAAAGIESAW